MCELKYRRGVSRTDLQENECTIRMIGGGLAQFVFCYHDKSNGERWTHSMPVRPNGQHGGPERAWGLNRSGPNRWQITPSINLGDDHWHETPAVVDVPDGEDWQT